MAKVNLDIDTDLHIKAKQLQLDMEKEGKNVSLKEVYYLLIKKGLTKVEEEKAK